MEVSSEATRDLHVSEAFNAGGKCGSETDRTCGDAKCLRHWVDRLVIVQDVLKLRRYFSIDICDDFLIAKYCIKPGVTYGIIPLETQDDLCKKRTTSYN